MQIIKATYDGQNLVLDERLELAPNTRVTVTVYPDDPDAEPIATALVLSHAAGENGDARKTSFADAIERYKVRGPRDWSERVDYYLGRDLSGEAE